MLDQKIQPLVQKIAQIQKLELTDEQKEAEVYQVIAVGVMEGINMAQELYNKVEVVEDVKQPSKIEENMLKHRKAKEAAAKLNVHHGLAPDGKPRFCTPDQFDPTTGKYKG